MTADPPTPRDIGSILVQVADGPWHRAGSRESSAVCGAFPSPPCHCWPAHAPLEWLDLLRLCPTCEEWTRHIAAADRATPKP